jgi:DNA-binding transcriptional LysR family regulator
VHDVVADLRDRRPVAQPDAGHGHDPHAGRAELGGVPPCLLTGDMQNRRIIDRQLAEAGTQATTTLESNSMLVLVAHVRTGRWASIMPALFAESLDLTRAVRAVPIRVPEAVRTLGLLPPERKPLPALTTALVDVAQDLRRRLRAQADAALRGEAAVSGRT